MPSDLSTLDLATINAAQGVIVAAIRNQCCQWAQESADAIADGRLSNALMLEHWSFAANLLAHKVGSEFTVLFAQTLDAQLNRGATTRSVQDQLLDALTLEVAAARPMQSDAHSAL